MFEIIGVLLNKGAAFAPLDMASIPREPDPEKDQGSWPPSLLEQAKQIEFLEVFLELALDYYL